ncbi:MAG: hypothetical protein ACYDAE_02840 [Steroidobacteraceae bacterium]
MPSLTRNTRRANSTQRLRAIGAGLALTLMSGAALADGAHRFVFTVYSDGPGGADVIAGRYRAALERVKSRSGNAELNSSATDTNRCVAYSMTLQWQEARAACDAAVRTAREQRNTPPWSWAPLSDDDDYLAVAYANRAVMYWLSHDDSAAQRDIAKAQALSPSADFVALNIVAFKVHRAVALAAAPARKS